MIAAATARAVFCADSGELWSTKVQPLFDVQCVKCHGPIEQKSGLELDTPDAVLKGGDEGKVITPGKPEESRLYQYLAAGSDPHMPPKKQLNDAEIALVREWIQSMGKGSENSAARPVSRVFATIHEAVDTYIAEGWEKRGVKATDP